MEDTKGTTTTPRHRDSLWERFGHSVERTIDHGYRATGRVVDSLEELRDAARVRVQKARIERARLKRSAELGSRLYELSKDPALPDGTPPQVLDDPRVQELLREVGTLEDELGRLQREVSEDGSGSEPAQTPS